MSKLRIIDNLKINVNELLSGERIMAEAYDKWAEENLLAMILALQEYGSLLYVRKRNEEKL